MLSSVHNSRCTHCHKFIFLKIMTRKRKRKRNTHKRRPSNIGLDQVPANKEQLPYIYTHISVTFFDNYNSGLIGHNG